MYAIVFHAHQKLDRAARRQLGRLLPAKGFFPSSRQIVHFEGPHGPDRPSLKRSEHSQPWHFIDPLDPADSELDRQIRSHYKELVKELRRQDEVRAAFQAAWLAHALVDGLTPAHHYPYERELGKLRGESRHTRKGLVGRAYVKGDTMRESIQKSLKLIGPKGLLTKHALFEGYAYKAIMPLRLSTQPTKAELEKVKKQGVVAVFKDMAAEVAGLNIYERFLTDGWTKAVNRDVRQELAPRMVQMITLAWYAAYHDSTKRRWR